MKLFKFNAVYSVLCEVKNTRTGFKHVATLLKYGHDIETAKAIYYNRTWERYTYESVLFELIGKSKALTEKEQKRFNNMIKKWKW